MAELEREIAAYKEMRSVLEAEHMGKWIVMHNEHLVGTYDSFDKSCPPPACRAGASPGPTTPNMVYNGITGTVTLCS